MAEESIERAIRALQTELGGYWQGMEDVGRREMVAILRDTLGYDAARAKDVIDALIASGQVRYYGPGESTDEAALRHAAIGRSGPASTEYGQGEVAGTPLVRGPQLGSGYWRIGREGAAEPGAQDASGRMGQVEPGV